MSIAELTAALVAVSLVTMVGLLLGQFLFRSRLPSKDERDGRLEDAGEQLPRRLLRALRELPIGRSAEPDRPPEINAVPAGPEEGIAVPSSHPSEPLERAVPERLTDGIELSRLERSAGAADRPIGSRGKNRMYGEAVADGVRIIGASVIGSSHERVGQPREDAFAWRQLARGGLVTAVADGVGSTRHADIAAGLAVRHVVHYVAGEVALGAEGHHWPGLATHALRLASGRLTPEAVDLVAERYATYPVPLEKQTRSPASTLLVTMLVPDRRGLNVYWAAVGDSHLLSRDMHRSLAWRVETGSTADQASRYLSNATKSLPRDLDEISIGHKHFESGTLILLATDGFIRTLEVRSSPADPFVAAEQLRSITPEAFLEAVDETLPQCWDDRTAILVEIPPKDERARPGYFWWGF